MTSIEKIKKRNGQIVDFDEQKIKLAIQKAFIAIRGKIDEEGLLRMTRHVIKHLEDYFTGKIPGVEDVQNMVENVLMEESHFDVAKAYIVYRYEHIKQREEQKKETLEKIAHHELTIIKRSGKKEKFDPEKLKKSLDNVLGSYENLRNLKKDIDTAKIVELCRHSLYERISTKEISQALILAVRSFIERDPAYSYLAARLLMNALNKEVIGSKIYNIKKEEQQYREAFIQNIGKAIEIGRLDRKMQEFDLEKLSKELKIERDNLLMYLGAQTLYDRYFIRNPETKEILETLQGFWMRVAMGLALNEEEKEERAVEFYNIISTLRFVPSTPTLFHTGTLHPQLSSCYLTTVKDSLDHIFKCIGDNAALSKWSGGLGNDWTSIRGTGALIQGTGVESQGVIPFLKIANDTTVAINRSGRRRGATCAYLETWHYDIEDFLELRKNTGDERRRTHDMNTANWIPDLFMKRVRENKDWTLFSTDETPDLHHIYGKKFEKRYQEYEKMAEEGKIKMFKKVKAVELWRKMITMLFETGHPWITFKDPCNIRSPQDHVGVVHSSNLCTEITLNTSEDETAVCNLGSLNLSRHITDGKIDKTLIQNTVVTAMRMLDNVIDINFYPTVEAKKSNFQHRPVGLGIMGFQDALYKTNINFDSNEARDFADESMEIISYYAILGSAELAKDRGSYETFKGSKWDRNIFPIDTIDLLEQERGEKIEVLKTSKLDWKPVREAVKKYGMRNSNCMAIAPTATISNIAGCIPSIEPIYKNIYVKSNMSGEFTVINPYLVEDLKALELWNDEMLEELKRQDGNIQNIDVIPKNVRDKYKETFDLEALHLITITAYRGKWIDQSQSYNVYVRGTSGKGIAQLYQHAWQMGLKTTYYLRSLAASSVEKSTISLERKARTIGSPSEASEEQIVQTLKETALSSIQQLETSSKENSKPLCKINDPDCEACQ